MINLGLYYGKSKGEVITDHKTVGAFVTEASGLFPDVKIVIDETLSLEFHGREKTDVEDTAEIESVRYENKYFVKDGVSLEIRITTKPAPKYEIHKGWVNVWRGYDGFVYCGDTIFDSKEEAQSYIDANELEVIEIVRIEWKEAIK